MRTDNTFLKRFDHHFRRINDDLGKYLASQVSLIEDITHYSLLGEGKRLRPLLFVLSSRLCGYEGEDVYHLSTIFEYIHAASLLHDDILDNAEMRRKKPSVRTVWGNAAAVLGGDFLYARASAIASERNNLGIIKMLSRVVGRMVEGQFVELEQTHNWHMTKEKYMDIIIAKTAALISAACRCGGLIAGSEKKAMDHLGEFGLNLGIAFQMIDDVLDYTSSETVFGKPVGKDLKEGKITLPLIYVLSDLEKAEIDTLEDLFKNHKASDKDYENIISMVREDGFIERIRSEAGRYVERATRFLELFPESSTKQDLLGLGDYIVKRKF